jgi:hypothetical protein
MDERAMVEQIRLAVEMLAPPLVVLNASCRPNEMYFMPAFPRSSGRGTPRALVLNPEHRWAVERLGLRIHGVAPRQAAPWTLDPLMVAQARLAAVLFKITRIRQFVRFLERVLP